MTLSGDEGPARPRSFQETQWLLISCYPVQPAREKEKAVAAMCRIYWPPIYHVLRERGFGFEEAEDLTQGFFLHFIKRDSLPRANRRKGRFRNFLLGALDNYLADERKRAQRQKRGGTATHISLDEFIDPKVDTSALKEMPAADLGDRAWAAGVLQKALGKLEVEYLETGRGELYHALKPHCCGEKVVPYQAISRQLGRSSATLRSDVRRLRARFVELLRRELRAEVGEGQLKGELENFRQIFRAN